MKNNCSLNTVSYLERLQWLKLMRDLKWNSYPSLRTTKKWLASFTVLEMNWLLLPCSINTRYGWDQKWSIVARSERELPKSSISRLDWLQKRLCSLVGDEIFPTQKSLSHRQIVASLSLFYRNFHDRCSGELGSFVLPVQTFKSWTRPVTDTEWTHPHPTSYESTGKN